MEGFGALAERQGAKAVIASLWPVADSSTKVLMQKFYRIRESSPARPGWRLREAQLELLGSSGKGVPKSPYAHPYYWAPFFLMLAGFANRGGRRRSARRACSHALRIGIASAASMPAP